MTHADAIGRLKDRYEPKINLLLQNIAEELRECGFTTDATHLDTASGEYCWILFVDDAGSSWGTVELTILEDRQGVNFSLTVFSSEGDDIFHVTPYNYSRLMWVDIKDEEAVADRWELFERSTRPADIVHDIQEFQALGA